MHKFPNKFIFIFCGVIIFSLLITGKGITAGRRKTDRLGADISLCTTVAGVFDRSYNEGTWKAMVDINQKYPDTTVNYYTPKEERESDLYSILEIAAKGEPKIIIATSINFAKPIGIVQHKNPEINYLVVDAVPSDENGNDDIAKNTLAISFSEHESGFLAGYAAVKDGYRDLGFVGGMANPAVKRFGYGFLYGANEASKDLGLKKGAVNVKYTYSGTFSPSPEIMSLATSWYDGGTEVIFAAAGSGGNSVIKAAEQCGKKFIGVDADMSRESEVVITSALKDIYSVIDQVITDYKEGNFKGGVLKNFSAKEHGVGLPMETSRFRTFDKAQYDEVFNRVVNGEFEMNTQAETPEEIKVENINVKVF